MLSEFDYERSQLSNHSRISGTGDVDQRVELITPFPILLELSIGVPALDKIVPFLRIAALAIQEPLDDVCDISGSFWSAHYSALRRRKEDVISLPSFRRRQRLFRISLRA